MSAATEYAPTVYIPARRALAVVPAIGLPAEPPATGRARRLGDVPDAGVTVLHRPGAPGQAAPLRLTRRGVSVLVAVLAVMGGVLIWAAAASASSDTAAGVPTTVHAVTVAPGDTLWSIAGRVAPDRDPRAEVLALQRRNHLAGVELTPGQRLAIP